MTKHSPPIAFRWPMLVTLALCTLLPGCPVTDNYFISVSSAGSGQLVATGGTSELETAGTSSVAGGPGVGGAMAGGPVVDPCPMCVDPSGGGGTGGGIVTPEAGSGGDAGSPDGLGGTGGSVAGGGGQGSTAGSAAGGVAGSAGGASTLPQPACDEGVSKNSVCSPSSVQLCYKGCGPDDVGNKPLACQNGAYNEPNQGCTFPTMQDYSCYSVPQSLPAVCPAGVPRGGSACQIAACTVCFGGSAFSPQYQDSTGAPKVGYCVCSAAGVWTCGTRPESWPCPNGPGCK